VLLELADYGPRQSTFSQVRGTFQLSDTASRRRPHEISRLVLSASLVLFGW